MANKTLQPPSRARRWIEFVELARAACGWTLSRWAD